MTEKNGRSRVEIGDLRVPFTEVRLTNGERHSLYNTEGPPVTRVEEGLPRRRAAWVQDREDGPVHTQLYYCL